MTVPSSQVVDKNTPWKGGLIAVNSFGFGGANAHVVLESEAAVEGGVGPVRYNPEIPRLVLASGRTDEAVEAMLRKARDHPHDGHLHALMDAVHAQNLPGHSHRGYVLLADEPHQEIAVSC